MYYAALSHCAAALRRFGAASRKHHEVLQRCHAALRIKDAAHQNILPNLKYLPGPLRSLNRYHAVLKKRDVTLKKHDTAL